MRLAIFLLGAASAHSDPVAAKPKQEAATHALLQSITDVAKSLTPMSSGTMTPDAIEIAISAASNAVSSMLPALETEHGAAQHEVELQFGEIGACSSHLMHGAWATSQHDASLQAQQAVLTTCNAELAAAQQEHTQACDAWTNHANALGNAQPACGHHSTPEEFYESFQNRKNWVEAEDAGIEGHQTGCGDATVALSSKQEECASVASDYNTAFCHHRLSCSLLGECQSHEIQVYEDLLVDIRLATSSRHDQFQTLKQLECMLGLITSAIQTNNTIAQDELMACGDVSDVSQPTLSIPNAPDAEVCPTPDHGDPVCPELAQVDDVIDWANGQAVDEQGNVIAGHCAPVSTSVYDAGYNDAYRGWFDIQGCGECLDYCRWVGNNGSGGDPANSLEHGSSYWSCRLAGGHGIGTRVHEHVVSQGFEGVDDWSTGIGYFTSWNYQKC